jgi:C_GCAxxG_C_C family probable redox protein
MNQQEIEQRAFALHHGGLHCAESVLTAILEEFQGTTQKGVPRMATCFGGGVGKTHQEICGALTGGLIALGCLCGRDAPGQDWSTPANLAAQLRERFLALYGSTRCADILSALGEQENMLKCKQLSGKTAGLLYALLTEQSPPE